MAYAGCYGTTCMRLGVLAALKAAMDLAIAGWVGVVPVLLAGPFFR